MENEDEREYETCGVKPKEDVFQRKKQVGEIRSGSVVHLQSEGVYPYALKREWAVYLGQSK